MFKGDVYVVAEWLPLEKQPFDHFVFQEKESILSLLEQGRIIVLFSNLDDTEHTYFQLEFNEEYKAYPYIVRGGHSDVLYYVLGAMQYIEDTDISNVVKFLRKFGIEEVRGVKLA